MKKMMALLLALTLVLSLGACGGKKDAADATDATGNEQTLKDKYVIGIAQYMEHAALDAATKGFKDVLTEKLGDKVTFDFANASGDPSQCSTIINGFVSKNVDLIMANATPMLQTAQAATTEIPILGTSVTEYGDALKTTLTNGATGVNISGTSDLAPLEKQGDMLIELFPEAKNVGLIYCSGEANSVYQINTIKAYLEGKGLTCTEYPFSDSNDLQTVTTRACQTSDVIYVPTDNTVASSTGVIDGICRPAKVPVVAGEEGIASGCGVATLSINYEELGRITGEMAYRVLVGGEDISTMPIEYYEDVQKKYNAEICEELGITVPEDYVAIE